jgi:uncharacterized protein with PIN domain
VFDLKVETVAYEAKQGILEVRFNNGQVWQLFEVPSGIYAELQSATISAFLKSIAHKFQSAPVKTGLAAVQVPESEKCPECDRPMTVQHRTGSALEKYVRVLWRCSSCDKREWRHYGQGLERERRSRWH